jgi:hypothetical protein
LPDPAAAGRDPNLVNPVAPLRVHASSARQRFNARNATSNRHGDWKSLLRRRSRQPKPSRQPTRLRSAPCRLGSPSGHETGRGTASNRRRPYRAAVVATETKLLSTWLAKSSTNFASVAVDAGIVIFVPAVVVTTISPRWIVTERCDRD